jgi:hypothetical protein
VPRLPGTPKTGGRKPGTPNKATRELKDFLGRVFARAFTETVRETRDVVDGDGFKKVDVDVSLEDRLVEQIVTLAIDGKLLVTLLAHWAGTPTKQVDVNHSGSVTLAQLIAGTAPVDEDEPPATPEGSGGDS